MRIVISGAYGMGNIGDEAIFETLFLDIKKVSATSEVTVLVFSAVLFCLAHPEVVKQKNIRIIEYFLVKKSDYLNIRKLTQLFKGKIAILKCDRLIIGGGGLFRNKISNLKKYLEPVFLAKKFNKKVFISNVGVDEISDRDTVKLIKRISPGVEIVVRDEYSRSNLSRLLPCRSVQVIPDPVFHVLHGLCVERSVSQVESNVILGLNITVWKAEFSPERKMEEFISSLANVLNDLNSELPFVLMYLPTAKKKDDRYFSIIRERLKMKILEPSCTTFKEYINNVSSCHVFLGMRLHSLILASNCNLPIIGIAYDEKVQQLKPVLKDDLLEIDEVINSPATLQKRLLHNLTTKQKLDQWEELKVGSNRIINKLHDFIYD